MKVIITFILLTIVSNLFAQVPADYGKIQTYLTEDRKTYTKRSIDSIWYFKNQFVSARKIRATADSVYYSVKYFDKKEVKDRYRVDGTFCGNEERKSPKEIRKISPYNSLHSVRVVSFKTLDNDSIYLEPEIPKTNGQIDFNQMFEVKVLDKELEGKMLDILLNYDNPDGIMEIFMCWEPRNAIIFLDKAEKVIGYIEICFECNKYQAEPKTLSLGQFCREKFDAVQGIMMAAGITYGMNVRPTRPER